MSHLLSSRSKTKIFGLEFHCFVTFHFCLLNFYCRKNSFSIPSFVLNKNNDCFALANHVHDKCLLIPLGTTQQYYLHGYSKAFTMLFFLLSNYRSRRPSAIAEQAPSSPTKQGPGEEKFSDRLDQLENHIYMKTRLDQLRHEDRLSRMESAINMLLEEKE